MLKKLHDPRDTDPRDHHHPCPVPHREAWRAEGNYPAGQHDVRRTANDTLIKALVRAFRWQNLIESRAYGTIDEIATAERINPSYVSRVLRMTLLAPDIVESILDGR